MSPYKKQVLIALLSLLISSLAWLLLGQGIKYVIDQGFVANNKDALQGALYLVIGVIIIGSLATYFRFYWMVWLGERVCADIRKKLFSHLLSLSPSFFEKTRTGEIISRFTSDTTLLQSVVGTGVSMALRSIVMFIGALILMAVTSYQLTIMVFVAVPLMLIPIRVLGNKVRTHSKLSQDKVAKVGGMIDESLHEIHTLQAYNHQHLSRQTFAEKIESVMHQAHKRIQFRALLIAIVMVISLSAIFIVAYMGALMVIEQSISVGELTAFVFYAVLAGGAIATISEVIGELQKAAGASERIIELMQQTPKLIDVGEDTSSGANESFTLKVQQFTNTTHESQASQTKVPTHSEDRPTLSNEIVISCKNIDFSYPTGNSNSSKQVINQLSFDVKWGQTVALVGHSGAGKSTIFELLQRFYDVDQGSIDIFGTPIKQVSIESLRKQFALVPQDAVIFAGSVNENIRFSNPNAPIQDVQAAAKMAFADEFIQHLPNAYDSELGERGVKLSGGQKQRIAIARAIVAKRPILLLDEATSALDANSEQYVKKALEVLMHDKTTLIIAHRLSTVVNADLILVIDNGKIIAQGTHANLYAKSSVYKEFVDLQLVQ